MVSMPEVDLPKVSIDQLKNGSTVMCLEAGLAIQVGKLAPVGYEQVADFFRNEHGRTTPAHNAWFFVEAEIAGRLDDLRREFPEVERLTSYIVDVMQRDHPRDVDAIKSRVSRPDYSFERTTHVRRNKPFRF